MVALFLAKFVFACARNAEGHLSRGFYYIRKNMTFPYCQARIDDLAKRLYSFQPRAFPSVKHTSVLLRQNTDLGLDVADVHAAAINRCL